METSLRCQTSSQNMGFWWQKAKRVTLSLASYPHCTRSARASGNSLTIVNILINCLVLLVTPKADGSQLCSHPYKVSFVVAHMLLFAKCYLRMYKRSLLSISQHWVSKLFVMSSLVDDCVICSCPDDDDEVTSRFRPLVRDCVMAVSGYRSHTSPSADPGALMPCCRPACICASLFPSSCVLNAPCCAV